MADVNMNNMNIQPIDNAPPIAGVAPEKTFEQTLQDKGWTDINHPPADLIRQRRVQGTVIKSAAAATRELIQESRMNMPRAQIGQALIDALKNQGVGEGDKRMKKARDLNAKIILHTQDHDAGKRVRQQTIATAEERIAGSQKEIKSGRLAVKAQNEALAALQSLGAPQISRWAKAASFIGGLLFAIGTGLCIAAAVAAGVAALANPVGLAVLATGLALALITIVRAEAKEKGGGKQALKWFLGGAITGAAIMSGAAAAGSVGAVAGIAAKAVAGVSSGMGQIAKGFSALADAISASPLADAWLSLAYEVRGLIAVVGIVTTMLGIGYILSGDDIRKQKILQGKG